MTWTVFYTADMTHVVYIEEDKDSALEEYRLRFNEEPLSFNCACCDSNYEYNSYDDLYEATAMKRHCDLDFDSFTWIERQSKMHTLPYVTLEEYVKLPSVIVVRKENMFLDDS